MTVSSPDKIQTLMMLKPEHHFEARYYCPFKKLSFLQGSGIMSQDGDFGKQPGNSWKNLSMPLSITKT